MPSMPAPALSEGEERPPKRFKSNYNDTIRVLAGKNDTPFTVHRDIVCAKSPYFVAACKDEWQNGEEGVVTLKKVGADVFKIYLHWLYSGTIDLDIIDVDQRCRNEHGQHHDELHRKCSAKNSYMIIIIRLYLAGDVLLDTAFQNQTINKLLEVFSPGGLWVFDIETLKYIWDNTLAGSTLRACMVDLLIARRTRLGKDCESYTKEFLFDVCNRQAEYGTKREYEKLLQEPCNYHEHGKDSVKCEPQMKIVVKR